MTKMRPGQELDNTVCEAYAQFARRMRGWPNKYNILRQTGKMLSDYALLSKVNLVNKRVLNVGCSEPDDELYFVNLVREWHALDVNEAIVETARKLLSEALPPHLYSKLKFMVCDAANLGLEDEYYDVVVSFSTVDHIPGEENRIRAISEMCRVLKSGGYLAITVPNKWNFYYSYRSNRRQKKSKAMCGYEYQFSPLELKRILTSNGLRILDCASTSFSPYSYPDRLLKELKLQKILICFGHRFGYLAQKT